MDIHVLAYLRQRLKIICCYLLLSVIHPSTPLSLSVFHPSTPLKSPPLKLHVDPSVKGGGPQWLSWMCVRLSDQEVAGSTWLGRQHSLVEINQEIVSTVILFLPLMQEGQLSVSGERICTKTV